MPGLPGPRPLRVAQALPPGSYSGVSISALQLAAHLVERGHHVEIWPLHDWDDEDRRAHRALIEQARVEVVEHPGSSLRQRVDALRRREVDVVHLHSVFVPQNALLARRLRGPYVVSPHSGYAPASLRRSAVRKRVFAALVERRYLRKAALRIALTDVEAEELRRFRAGAPVAVVPHGVDPWPEPIDRQVFRQELGLDPGVRLLVYAGRLDVLHKGLDVLIRGVAEAPSWHLALVGPDARAEGGGLRDLAQDLGMADRLTLVGPLLGPRLHEAVAGADLFALTSRWEGLPLSLLEALAVGVPVLVSPAVGARVPVEAAGAGWVAEPHEVGAVLRSLAALDRAEWQRRSQAARALAGTYEWPRVAARYEDLYRSVAGASPHLPGGV